MFRKKIALALVFSFLLSIPDFLNYPINIVYIIHLGGE